MTWEQALDLVVSRTGHQRYRWLCSEDNPDTEQRAAYRRLVISQAVDQPTAGISAVLMPAVESIAALKLVRRCHYRSVPSCGCEPGRCGLRGGKWVSDQDCLTCVSKYGES